MNNDTKKGVFIGILLTVAAIMLFNTARIGYRTLIKDEINYTAKEKTIYDLMKENYVEDISDEDIYEGLFTGMVALATDKYSRYISAEDYKSYEIDTQGNYAGIGTKTTVSPDDYSIYIISTYEDSPARKAGIKPGDKIIKVNGTDVTYENYDDAINSIRGPEGTTVELTIKRGGTTFNTTVTREHVDVPTVGGALMDNNVGYIKIEGFEAVTYDQYKEVYNSLRDKGITSLIIDLRNNPGGLLDSVASIADDIIPEGTITYTEDKNGEREYIKSAEGEIDIPLAVIVNENSASAAELLTAAVKDTGKGIIVGKTTYGKGVVQTTYPLTDGSAVKLTTSRYYTPKGVCIDKVGITPDIEVDAPQDFEISSLSGNTAQYDLTNDTQLIKAYEYLINDQ